MKIKPAVIFAFLLCSFHLPAQTITFPLQMEAQAFKDSLVYVFNHPIKFNSTEDIEDQLYTRFPWLKAIDNHRRYHLSLRFEGEDLLAGYGYLKHIQLTSVNTVNDQAFGNYAPIDLPFATFNTGDAYTISELNDKSGFRKVNALELDYYRRHYILPDGYDEAGIILQVIKEDPKEYRSIKRPDGIKFDKDGSEVITGYIIQRINKADFDEDNNLNFSEQDWKHLDDLHRRHFATFFYNKYIDYFQKYNIDRAGLEPIIANDYLLKGDKAPDLDAAVADYQLRTKIPKFYEQLREKYQLVGSYGFDEANEAFVSSLIYPCLEGDCNYGEGTVDMGKTTFTGTFKNSFGTIGVLTEKSSGIKIKVNFNTYSKLLSSGEYISDPNLKATFKIKNDSIFFDVDTKTFSYVGTTKGLSGRSGIISGIHTVKKENLLEIYTYRNGLADSKSATIRERSVGEFEYTGAFKQVEGEIFPFGEGRISFPYYSKESVPIHVTGNLFDAIQASPEAMKLLVSIFEANKEINTPYLKNWYQDYLKLKDANRYATIQKFTDDELVKYVFWENDKKLKYLKTAHGTLSDLINRDWRDERSPKAILLINLKDGPSNFCLRSQNGQVANVKYTFDEQCVSFEKRGDVQEIRLKVLTTNPYQIKLICEDCNADDYYAIVY
ncbi:MAG: hypothetical protein KDD32_06010 [Bacteroidetes bacterium]|nr:hypothetical protein [Bacteroidota bacterium]